MSRRPRNAGAGPPSPTWKTTIEQSRKEELIGAPLSEVLRLHLLQRVVRSAPHRAFGSVLVSDEPALGPMQPFD